jgi:tetratricopeptide (TPR) repeat protein
VFRFLLASVIGLALTISAYADEHQYADAIYMEAVDLYIASKNASDVKQRLKNLRLAHGALKQLIEQYPSTPAAKRVGVRLSGTDVSLEMLQDEIWQAGWALCPQRLNRACVLEFALTTADFAAAQTARDWAIMAMVDMHADAGDFDAAIEMAKEIKHVSFWPSARERVARAQAAAGDSVSGLATAMEIQDPDERVRALAGVIAESGGANRATPYREAVVAALAASEHVGYLTFLPQALAQISEAQAIAGDFDGALETAARIGEVDEASRQKLGFALAKIARLQAEAGHVDQAKGTIEKALGVAERTMDIHPRAGIRLQIMEAQIAARDMEAARMTADSLGERYRMVTLVALYKGYASANDEPSAREAFESALHLLEGTTDAIQRVDGFGGIGLLLAKTGRVEEARRMFDRALAAAEGIANMNERAGATSRLAKSMSAAGNSELTQLAALALRELVENDGEARLNPILVASFAGYIAEMGDVTTAMAFAAQVGDMEQRVRALIEIAKALPNG